MLQHWCNFFIQTAQFPVLFPHSCAGLLPNLPLFSSWSYMLFPGPFQSGTGTEPVAEPEEEEEMLQHLLCFLCPCQASAMLPDQHWELGREAERKGCSGRTLVALLSVPDPPNVEGHLLLVLQCCTQWLRTHCKKMCTKWSRLTGEGKKPLSDTTGGILVDRYGHLAYETGPKYVAYCGRLVFFLS